MILVGCMPPCLSLFNRCPVCLRWIARGIGINGCEHPRIFRFRQILEMAVRVWCHLIRPVGATGGSWPLRQLEQGTRWFVDRALSVRLNRSQSECLTASATELPEQADDASNNDSDNDTKPTVGFCRNLWLIVDFENFIIRIIFQLISG